MFLVIVPVFFAGSALGWLAASGHGAGSTATIATAEAPRVQRESAPNDAAWAHLRDERDRLETANAELTAQLAGLEEELATLRTENALWDEFARLDTAAVQTPEPFVGSGEATPEQRRAERRDAFLAQRAEFASRMNALLDERFAAVQDPVAVERLNAALEWRDYQRDLGRRLRDAETDEARQALRAEMENARWNAEQLVAAQQDDLIRGIAAAFAVPEADRPAFIEDMRGVLADPFFELEPMLTGARFWPPEGRRLRGGFANYDGSL